MIKRDYQYDPSQANKDIQLQGVQYERNPETEYGEHIRNTKVICNSCASHTYGNVLAIVEKYLLADIFPQDLFKTVTASTTLASRQVTHLPNQLQKKELPIMVLIPRVVFGQDENRFLGHTIFNDHFTNTDAFWGDGSLIPLAEDKRKRLWIHGHYNRSVMYIDVILTFNTYSEQINWMNHLYNIGCINHTKFIRAPLELFIPEEFCLLIAKLTDIPLKDNDQSVYHFLRYMNSIWYHPITYKLNGGSNTDEFFMYYIADIDFTIQEPQPPGAGIKDGQIRRGFDVSFTIRCDFNTIGYFMLNHPDLKKSVRIHPKNNVPIVSLFSDVINLNDFVLPVGWQILSWPIFKLDFNKNYISIDGILNQSLRTVIDYHLQMGLPMETFINIQFREDGEILTNEMFYIDWGSRTLVLMHPDYRRTYRLIVMVSIEYINNLVKELYNLE